MTYDPGWRPPTPPPPPTGLPATPHRYATKWIWIGVAVGIAATIALPWIGVGIGAALGQVWSYGAQVMTISLATTGGLVPLVLGIVFTAREGTPTRRGLALGVIIGWALAPIVFAGACFLIIVGIYSSYSP